MQVAIGEDEMVVGGTVLEGRVSSIDSLDIVTLEIPVCAFRITYTKK